jgi:hypothetical protein
VGELLRLKIFHLIAGLDINHILVGGDFLPLLNLFSI